MSAFAVFSMMGFYPVTPGKAEYQWGSPTFRKVTLHLAGGRDFVVEAPAASQDAKYVRAMTIDGAAADDSTALPHAVVARGAHVKVDMSERPNPKWGAGR